MQLSREAGINIWFKERWELEFLLDGGGPICVDLFTWGLPDAGFTWNDCDFDSHFNAQNLLFDLTFCVSWFIPLTAFANCISQGDWAGNVYPGSGCPSNCTDCEYIPHLLHCAFLFS
jgi:hypothetical protein